LQSKVYFFHERACLDYQYHQGVNQFIQLADESDEVPDLKGKSYTAFKLSPQEWTMMELMRDVLQVHLLTPLLAINQ
jgi:hypothetical protein